MFNLKEGENLINEPNIENYKKTIRKNNIFRKRRISKYLWKLFRINELF